MIIKRTLMSGSTTVVTYDDESNLSDALRKKYKNQGALYLDKFKVTYDGALMLGWHPMGIDFSSVLCEGFKTFLLNEGIIPQIEKVERLPITIELLKTL